MALISENIVLDLSLQSDIIVSTVQQGESSSRQLKFYIKNNGIDFTIDSNMQIEIQLDKYEGNRYAGTILDNSTATDTNIAIVTTTTPSYISYILDKNSCSSAGIARGKLTIIKDGMRLKPCLFRIKVSGGVKSDTDIINSSEYKLCEEVTDACKETTEACEDATNICKEVTDDCRNAIAELPNSTVAKAKQLETARTISLTGSVTGSGSFDGSKNLSINTTTNHTHNYAGSATPGGAATTALTAAALSTARTIQINNPVTSVGNGTLWDASRGLEIEMPVSIATSSIAGLVKSGGNVIVDTDGTMSISDDFKVNIATYAKTPIVECETSDNYTTKEVSISGFTLIDGVIIHVYFQFVHPKKNSSGDLLYLNVENTGAIRIVDDSYSDIVTLCSGIYYTFKYDATYNKWVAIGNELLEKGLRAITTPYNARNGLVNLEMNSFTGMANRSGDYYQYSTIPITGTGGTTVTTDSDGKIIIDSPTVATTNLLTNYYSSRPTSANLTPTGSGGLCTFKATSSMTTGKPAGGDSHILHMFWDNTQGFDSQIAVRNDGAKMLMQMRAQNAGVWKDWVSLLDSNNYANYTRKIALVGSDAENSNGWYKVATQTCSGYGNTNITFMVTSTFGNYNSGILQLQIGANDTSMECNQLKWHTRIGFYATHFIVVISGMTWTLYAYQPNTQYGRIAFEILSQSSGSSKDQAWPLTFSNNNIKETTAPTATVVSSDGSSATVDSTKLPLSGGTMTGDIVPYIRTSAGNSFFGFAKSGTIRGVDGKTDFTDDRLIYQSVIGTVETNTDGWQNIINIRHKDGNGDGNKYGLQISSLMTSLTDSLRFRHQNYGNWGDWLTLFDSDNYGDYVPSKTGSGASGTWKIDITGNSATATRLQTVKNIKIGNAVKQFDGLNDVSFSLSDVGVETVRYVSLFSGSSYSSIALVSPVSNFDLLSISYFVRVYSDETYSSVLYESQTVTKVVKTDASSFLLDFAHYTNYDNGTTTFDMISMIQKLYNISGNTLYSGFYSPGTSVGNYDAVGTYGNHDAKMMRINNDANIYSQPARIYITGVVAMRL